MQVFALVGEAIAGATHALLAGDREAAKQLVQRGRDGRPADRRDRRPRPERSSSTGETRLDGRRELVAVLRMLPDLDRNGDLAEHIARRAARGPRRRDVGPQPRARRADGRGRRHHLAEHRRRLRRALSEPAPAIDDLDDELDDLHVTLTAELVAGTMPLPVAIELAMVARFYERFGDHAVNLARRMAALVGGGPEPGTSGAD